MIKRMIETLILWNLVRTRDELRGEDDSSGWFIIPMFVISALLWPIGLLMTARHYLHLSWIRSILSTVVISVLVLRWVPEIYLGIAAIVFVVAVWYFGNEEE
jgi:hypothetical protein